MNYKGWIKYLLVATTVMLSITGCKKWLDTEAPLQVDQEELFSTEQGFRDVMNGVYLQMGDATLYGRDMTFGFLSVLGRSYDTTISPAIGPLYYQGARYNFQDPTVQGLFTKIWANTYQCINNLNSLLANIDAKQGLFTGNNFATIKGEAIALRAFLHFDLVRMFGTAPSAGGNNIPAIPFVTTVGPKATPVSTTGVVIDKCIDELNQSLTMLSNSDAGVEKLTYWGVKGLLARIYMYKGDLANAQTQALSIINSNKFPLATTASDLMFTKEHLFSLYSYQVFSNQLYKSVLNTNPPLGFSIPNQNALFITGSGISTDFRRVFNDPGTGGTTGNTISPRKCYASTANILPMIRMTEMYYIAAECAVVSRDSLAATNWMDSVRVHRNVPKYTLAALKLDSLAVEITKEYQKEFMSEGQMFYFYKRRNIPFALLPFTKVPVVANASYVFIKPE
ncbi:MAG TPA: RagB/SusD family nutrient uptake outer membrane protein [Phnomibacter sp.]|nr:RagB/SusD family nutrient uptake outer membrane protein [Phnomibacter sp.]